MGDRGLDAEKSRQNHIHRNEQRKRDEHPGIRPFFSTKMQFLEPPVFAPGTPAASHMKAVAADAAPHRKPILVFFGFSSGGDFPSAGT